MDFQVQTDANNPMDTKLRIDRLDFWKLYLPPLGHRRRYPADNRSV
jgi:hypothetical protein